MGEGLDKIAEKIGDLGGSQLYQHEIVLNNSSGQYEIILLNKWSEKITTIRDAIGNINIKYRASGTSYPLLGISETGEDQYSVFI